MSSTRKTRVLLLSTFEPLSEALARRNDFEVFVMNESPRAAAAGPRRAVEAPVAYIRGVKLSWRSIRSVRQAICRVRPDVVHSFLSRPLAHAVLAKKSLRGRSGVEPPKIVSFRAITAPAPFRDPAQWITYRSREVDAHACVSGAALQALVASGVDAAKCGVVYNCLDRPLEPPVRQHALAQWRVPADAFVVATVSTMRAIKGIDVLLKAAIECADLADLHLVLMGAVQDPRIERLAGDPRIASRVRLLGHRDDASKLVGAADVLAMPSRTEGLPRAMLEAMSQGVCPLVSDAGGMKEVVRDGRDGLVTPREDVAALAQAIRRLHADRALTARYAASARQRVAESFTADAMAARCAELYGRAMNAATRWRQAA